MMTAVAEMARESDQEYELVNGQWEAKEMAGLKHGKVIMRLGARMQMPC